MLNKLNYMKADLEIKAEEKRLSQEYLSLVGEKNWSLEGLVAYSKEHGSEKLREAYKRSKDKMNELC